MENESIREVLDRLGWDLGMLVSPEGRVVWANGPTFALLGGALEIGDDVLDSVHTDDRGSALALLTSGSSVLAFASRAGGATTKVRLRHADGGWRVFELRHDTDSDGNLVIAGRDLTDHDRARCELEVSEAVIAMTIDDLPAGVAFDAIARAAQGAVPGAQAAVYVARDDEFELVAAPNLAAGWSRRAFRVAAIDGGDAEPVSVQSTRGELLDLAAEFQLGHPWVVAVHGPAPTKAQLATPGSAAFIVVFVGEKRFLRADERSALEQVGRLTVHALTTDARRSLGAQQSQLDELTTVSSRTALLRDLNREPCPSTVIAVRVRGLAAINAAHGFEAGDTVLASVGANVRSATRGRDLVGRLDDTTFVACSFGQEPPGRAGGWLERLRQAVGASVIAAGTVFDPDCVLVQVTPEPYETALDLVKRAQSELQARIDTESTVAPVATASTGTDD